jgi:hypothetical protein
MLVTRQQVPNTHQWTNWEEVFCMRSVRQLHNATIELLEVVFSMRSMLRCYKQERFRV